MAILGGSRAKVVMESYHATRSLFAKGSAASRGSWSLAHSNHCLIPSAWKADQDDQGAVLREGQKVKFGHFLFSYFPLGRQDL
jgi:hypothetical protein